MPKRSDSKPTVGDNQSFLTLVVAAREAAETEAARTRDLVAVKPAHAHRARLGVNYKQIPVNTPKVPVHSYSKDGAMRIVNASDPVYAPNSKGGPKADSEHYRPDYWHTDGDLVRSAYTLRVDDDDWSQPGTMVRQVLDDAARERLVGNIAGHLLEGVTEPVLQRAFQYWRNVDKTLGDRVEQAVRTGQG
jgi:catalase